MRFSIDLENQLRTNNGLPSPNAVFFWTPEVSEGYSENQLRTNNGLPSPDALLLSDPRGVRMVPAQGETKWGTRELQR